MEIVVRSLAFVVAAACAGIMGFAIQRGATCTVAAVDEVVGMRGFRRLAAMVEASVWVAGGLVLAQAFHLLGKMPPGYPVGWLTVGGGMLLGLGAYVNRACVFGAIARLGSGEWAYALTPLGFYAGCASVDAIAPMPAPQPLPGGSPILQASGWTAALFATFVAWRLARVLVAMRGEDPPLPLPQRLATALTMRLWTPHAATTVIGVTFVVMLVLVGAWAYTDALADLAHGMTTSAAGRIILVLALLAGAMVGGWTAGRFRSTAISAGGLGRCFAGGVLMGWGTLLIPGSNDGLILVGMPLLWPYAWVAFATMCVSIAMVKLARRSDD